jgi:hypothetical protein
MPLDNLFSDETSTLEDQQKKLYERFGVLSNPFPSAGQTSGHPHMPTAADQKVDEAVKIFYNDRKSHVIAITATQGIGKTNLLNAYTTAFRKKLSPRGFFIIRYIPDPEPSFDPLIKLIFESLGEDYLRNSINKLVGDTNNKINDNFTTEVKQILQALLQAKQESEEQLNSRLSLAYQWFIGLPVRKKHQDELGVYYRLDTVESKTRALRDIVYFGAEMGTLQGIILLLDELEKQDASLSKTLVLRYLSALRALIDALPRYLFLMVALTTDALERYKEMLPALRGRLAHEVQLAPLRDEADAVKLWQFYLQQARNEASHLARDKGWNRGEEVLINELKAKAVFDELLKKERTIQGVRQRDYLNTLYNRALPYLK